ncbi:GAF domain-containing sensor histidine kinase [Arthrobacter sp. efr-133-TYG-118]|uniref:sensor histidine kinase n=1 Tax=Arthrobacter sp. efr-133-TYG-118 TaxID=3040279 RepID=UPI00254ECA3B|nr:GAF domain-containing sensor histidine kinase [Arthrobacter sp. efr-133-TYG-118]
MGEQRAQLYDVKEQARQAALSQYGLPGGILPRAGHEYDDALERRSGLDKLAGLAAKICGVPYGVVNIITAEEQHQIAAAGLEPAVCSREESMCARTFLDGVTTVIRDASADPRFTANPFVTGEIANVRFYASVPLVAASGHVLGTLCVFSDRKGSLSGEQEDALETLAAQTVDVLELRHRTRLLDEAMKELRRSNESLTEFAGRVSHDLRNPLTAIIGYVELSEQDPAVQPESPAVDYLHSIGGSGRRMLAMLDDLLSYSRLGGALDRSTISLRALVSDIEKDLHPAIEETGAIIECNDIPLSGDPAQLRTLLQNLVSNSLSYRSPGKTPKIRISGELIDDVAVLRVIDNGRGIPPSDRHRVLEPLIRLQRDSDGPGSGLGLATCMRVVSAHEGKLTIGETPGGGTTVTVSLPSAAAGQQK